MLQTRRAKLFATATLLAALVGAVFGYRAIARSLKERAAATAWAQFAHCIVGPAQPEGRPSEVLRRIELGVLERKRNGTPDPRDAEWPVRCAIHARELDRRWSTLRGDSDPVRTVNEIGTPLLIIASELESNRVPTDDSGIYSLEFDGLWLTSRELPRRPTEPSTLPAPEPLPLTQISALRVLGEHLTDDDPVTAGSLRLGFGGPPASEVWMFSDSDDSRRHLLEARSYRRSAALHGEVFRMVAIEDGALPVVATLDHRLGGVYAFDTGKQLLVAPTHLGAFAKANGFVAVVERSGASFDDLHLLRRTAGGESVRSVIDRPKYGAAEFFGSALVADWMLWLERRPGDDPTLFARRIDESPAGMGPVEELGMLPTSFAQGGARARACRSAKALFVDVADSGDRRALLVHRDGRWHPVLTPSAAGGTLTCSGDRAAYTWAVPASAGPGLVVHHTVCSAASCSTQTVALSSIDDTGKDQIAVTTLGDRIVLVTLEDALELRIAPLLDLPAAPVRFLADISEGQLGGSRVYEARLRTRRDTAVLLLRTREGFVALRVSADAQVDPVSVIPLAP